MVTGYHNRSAVGSCVALATLVAAIAAGCTDRANSPTPAVQATSVNRATVSTSDDEGKSASDPLPITWDDLDLNMEPDSVYESWMMTTRAKASIDRYVRITGNMYGGLSQQSGVRTFPLMRELNCPFGPGGQAHHVIEVNLPGKMATKFTTAPITVEGYLTLSPFTGTNGKTWSLYHLEGTKIQ